MEIWGIFPENAPICQGKFFFLLKIYFRFAENTISMYGKDYDSPKKGETPQDTEIHLFKGNIHF